MRGGPGVCVRSLVIALQIYAQIFMLVFPQPIAMALVSNVADEMSFLELLFFFLVIMRYLVIF